MADIIDIAPRLVPRDAPDADCLRKDDYGRQMFLYFLSYEMHGKSYGGVEVWAYSLDDAEDRVVAMRESLSVLGQAMGIVPA